MAYYYIPSTYNPNYDMSGLLPLADVTTPADVLVRPGQRTLVVDYLDQNFQNILNRIQYWNNATYSGQKWTTLCYKMQGTTAAFWLNLAFNGLDAPWQLQSGMVLRFPTIAEISKILSDQTSNDGVGRIISIGPPNVVGQL